MWFVILLIAAIVIYIAVKSKQVKEDEDYGVPANITPIISFIHGISSLSSKHTVYNSGVAISCTPDDSGYKFTAYTKILKIDGMDASERIDMLRMSISQAKKRVDTTSSSMNPLDIYKLKSEAKNKLITDFWGTTDLSGDFWDIDDCEYVDGKHVEFEASIIAFSPLGQSKDATFEEIREKVSALYSSARFEFVNSNYLVISNI